MMTAADVLQVLACLESAGIEAWLDGGWGVDALVGEHTRDHDDVDTVLALDRVEDGQRALAALGFELRTDWLPTRCALRDDGHRQVDFHPVRFDHRGNGFQRGLETDYVYPARGFAGTGRVAGQLVRCLTAEVQVLHHLGYPPKAKDRHDMELLRDRLGVELAPPYA